MSETKIEIVRQKKVLCICAGGVVRSVSQAEVLKYSFGQDAIAASHERNSKKTMDMLTKWADIIIVMQPEFATGILKQHQRKIVVNDVGPDVWRNPLDPELRNKCGEFAQELYNKGAFSEKAKKTDPSS